MKTDSIFYEIFQSSPGVLLELIGIPPIQGANYGFVSQEVKQTRFQIDGILLPHHRRPDLPIYFVEVQGYRQKDGESLYHTLFSEINLYLNDYRPQNDWRGVLIFTERRFDPGLPQHYQDYEKSPRLQRIYLDHLPEQAEGRSLEVEAIQLIGVKKQKSGERARALVERARAEITDASSLAEIIELVNTVCVYKFPELSREEIEAMLGLSELRQTRVFQEAKEEGREEVLSLAVFALLEVGLTNEQVAAKLNMDIATVDRIIKQQRNLN